MTTKGLFATLAALAFLAAIILGMGVVLLLAGPAEALTIKSGDGTESCATNATFPTASCAQGTAGIDTITPHSAWQPDFGGAAWISYANTGVGAGATLAPITSHTVPDAVPYLLEVTESFTTFGDHAFLNLYTWADDTAKIKVDGVTVASPNFSQATCANGVLGCEPNEGFVLADYDLGAAGDHVIDWKVFQVGVGLDPQGNPFGLLYYGDVIDGNTPVPEPATLLLLGSGLVGAGVWAKRRR